MNRYHTALLVIISINGMIHSATIEDFLGDHPDSYWLVADVLSIEWRKGCLTTAGCAEPRFQVTKMNTANNEANLISWPVTLKSAEVSYQANKFHISVIFLNYLANISVLQHVPSESKI